MIPVLAGLTGEALFNGLIKYGPVVFEWAKALADTWTKEMTAEQLNAKIEAMPKTYEQYVTNAGGRPALTGDQLAALNAKFTPDQVAALLTMFPVTIP